MNRHALVFLFLLVSSVGYAQMNGEYNYSIGLRAYTVKQMPRILDETGSEYFTAAPLNGALIKFNDNQISYRLSGTYYNKDKRFFNNCESCEIAEGKLIDYSFKVGFEKNFNYARIQPYFAVDLGYRSSAFSGEVRNLNTLKQAAYSKAGAAGVPPETIETSKVGLIITPVLGIKFSPVAQVSLFVEGNVDYFYSYERRETTIQDAENTKNFAKYYKSEFLLNPFSIGIQVHLGSNK